MLLDKEEFGYRRFGQKRIYVKTFGLRRKASKTLCQRRGFIVNCVGGIWI